MNLNQMGWKNDSNEIENIDSLARISVVHRGLCKAITLDGEINVHLSGKFHYEIESFADRPATGDFIITSPPFIDEQGVSAAILKEILPRRSKISRIAAGTSTVEQVLVSNVDYAFIVTSANEDLNVNRLQRFILLARQGKVEPVILLSKIDLTKNEDQLVESIKERIADIEILKVSSMTKTGFEAIKEKLKEGTSSVFLGSSGVGKSTIVNELLGQKTQAVQEIREDDAKGKHTTTSRELFFTPEGAIIIDTAGLREVQVFAHQEAIESTFEIVTHLIDECKFSNCTHQSEPGCAILDAIESGELPIKEFENYQKLQREAAYAVRKTDKAASANAKKKWKTITMNYRAKKKFEDR